MQTLFILTTVLSLPNLPPFCYSFVSSISVLFLSHSEQITSPSSLRCSLFYPVGVIRLNIATTSACRLKCPSPILFNSLLLCLLLVCDMITTKDGNCTAGFASLLTRCSLSNLQSCCSFLSDLATALHHLHIYMIVSYRSDCHSPPPPLLGRP